MVQLSGNQLWKSKRYLVVFLTFLGYLNHFARVNVSVAVVAMVDPSQENSFDWDAQQKGVVLSSFYYGYIATHILGGFLSARYGGNIILCIGIVIASIASLITPPIVMTLDIAGMIVLRVIQGLASGLAFPCFHAIFSKWAPVDERSTMIAFAMCGTYFGTVVANLFSGVIAVSMGWPAIYYVFGALGLIWSVFWTILVGRSPEEDRFISTEEKNYIVNNRGKSDEKLDTPWKSLFTSIPVLAITIGHISFNWGFYTLFTDLPSYLKNTLKFDLETTGYISAIPYLMVGTVIIFTGYLADWLNNNGYLTLTQIRKWFICLSFLAQAILLVIIGYLTNPIACVVLLTLTITSGALAASGFIINPIDIAPQYASIILGISNTVATISGIVSPIITGTIVSNSTFEQWRTIFFINASIYTVGAVLYYLLASAEIQPWALKAKRDLDETIEHNNSNLNQHAVESIQSTKL